MDVFVYKKAVGEICKENRHRVIPGTLACSEDCIFKKYELCNGYPGTSDSIINVANKIDDKSVEIVNNWLNNPLSYQ